MGYCIMFVIITDVLVIALLLSIIRETAFLKLIKQ